ncbi:MAG TPA: hypothetical protein VNV61_16435 [Steroidobacteraceae bacterium]|nr:hypothetical protein [Steroidobacteraceae bacterium]
MRWATLAWILATAPAAADDIAASPPTELSVTVYRAPFRAAGSIDLDGLAGFALVSEVRTVHLPQGLSRLRFEGVADGIEPASAIVTGLPPGVIEKNREGKLLSPSALIAATLGKAVTLLRTDRKTGKQQRLDGTLLSDAKGGVVFQTSEGIEALRCSGLPETFSFAGVDGLAAKPTLSVLVRSAEASTRTVTLSYLARNFDWAADYVATLSSDGKTMDLGAWVTLANGNGVGFPSARTQVVAGRVNRENGEVEPFDAGGPIFARCWPRGSTSDLQWMPGYLQFADEATRARMTMFKKSVAGAPELMEEVAVTGARNVQQEQLGDLKLYRIPEHTTVASRQSKQVRLMDRGHIPIARVYGADLAADESASSAPAHLLLRTVNTMANHLGLPLPSGHIAVFVMSSGEKLLLHESDIQDRAVDEEVEIDLGDSPDVQVTVEKTAASGPARTQLRAVRADITNARPADIDFELRLQMRAGGRIVHADHPVETKNGRPLFRLTIPANGSVTVRYQTEYRHS